jgi:outer membrane protein assembly factor BamD
MRRFAFSTVIAALLLTFSACAPQTVVPPAKQASVYFQEGEKFFEQRLYQDAIASWEKVRDSYYSPELNTLAELKIAETYFLAEQYIEAAAAYEAFLKNHPDHPKVKEVLFQLGLSYLRQMNAKDQDQTVTRQALAAFQTLQQRFPEKPGKPDPQLQEAKVYIDRCLNQLAAHEVEVGRYYLKVEKYNAAINRLEGVFKKYPNYYDRAEAYYLLGQAYLLAGEKAKASEAFNTLFNQFPQSEYILASQKFIEKNY